MKNTTKIALAGLLSATSTFINALAAELSGDDQPQVDPTPEAPRRGRKPAAAAVTTAAETAQTATEVAEPAESTEAGKTYEELRALIEPLVKGGQGEDVKKVIAKYGANLKEIATKPGTHAAFEKDLAALSY